MAESQKNFLGKYELLEVIGDGAEGRVYKASCAADDVPTVARGELVAVKRLKHTGHDKESQQFLRQIAILSKLNHPNIVRHKDSFVWREKELEEDIHCLVMELLDGEPLKLLIEKNRGGLPWETAGGILSQTLQALQYASKNGVIHRDLKPSNIYITTAGVPKLVDFGIARQDDGEATATSSAAGAKGTFDYMAPDFALQHGGFRGDEQSDIFSFGVILYYTLAGSLPFPPLGEHADRGYYIRWLGQPLPSAEYRHPVFRVLSHARTCISKCIDPDRQTRFKTFDELVADFAQIGFRKLKHGGEIYEFTGWLGKGGFGEVFRARRVRDQRDVAIKRLFSTGHSARFVREAKILRAAKHPNLTEYVDFVEVRQRDDEREFYLVLEYLAGMPEAGLRNRINDSPAGLDPAEALQLFVRYLDCLEHLHRNGIIHRDLKPGNLYAPAGNPQGAKIFDLGIAHDEEGTRTHGQVPGTLDFMPPEFATQTSERGSAQSDIYSIGVTLYQSLTKNLPFPRLPEKEAEAWIAFFRRSEKPLDCQFNHPVFKSHPELIPLLRRALAHDPRQRFASAGDMRDAIKKILPKLGVPAFRFDDEPPTAATLVVPAPAPAAAREEIEDIEVDPAEAETKVADLAQIERELAPAATMVAPAESGQQRRAAAELEKNKCVEIEFPKPSRWRPTAKTVKLGGVLAAVAVLGIGGCFAWNKTKLQRQEYAFNHAVEQANASFQSGDFAAAISDAERALAIHQEKSAMQKLVADARGQIQLHESYSSALQSGQSAFDRRDYSAAATWAAAALKKLPNDPAATTLLANAQMFLADYRNAVNRANAAFNNGDFAAASAAADQALAICKDDPAMRQLKANAQTQIANERKVPPPDSGQRQLNDYHAAVIAADAAWQKGDLTNTVAAANRALAVYNDAAMQQLKASALAQIASLDIYHDALSKAQTAFDNQDYASAATWAATALEKMPGDAAATKIKQHAQTQLDAFSDTASQAQSAFQQGDFAGAVTLADKALTLRKDDATMLKLKNDILRQLDASLVTLLESFNISAPAEIRYAQTKPTPALGAIGDAGKPLYQSQADKLEKAYRAGNWLGEGSRQTSLHDLRRAIDGWR